jgi:D-alanyl-lipoteichoic acid acyltransferase DltB (MBOAT superfamily)
MEVGSLAFLGFASLVLAAYWLLPPERRIGWLALASIAYVLSLGIATAAVLGALTVFTVVLGELLKRGEGRRSVLLVFGIALTIAAMIGLRRASFAEAAGIVGLSFFGLQAISYLVDVSRPSAAPRPSLVEVTFYLLYFCKLPAGPVERATPFFRELGRSRTVDDDAVLRGATLLGRGLVRKFWIGDALAASIPRNAFTAGSFDSGASLYALIAALFSLYNDFAGYTDIVRGTSAFFGIELSPNFGQPFLARSFAEFWSSWHASLMAWLRDYVYLPMSRAILRRDPRIRSITNIAVPPVATMVLSGAWHGLSPHFLVWGALHGSYLAAERAFAVFRRRRVRLKPPHWHVAIVFSLGLVAFVPFQMDLRTSLDFLRHVSAQNSEGVAMLIGIAATLLLDAAERLPPARLADLSRRRPVRVALLALVILGWFLSAVDVERRPFAYPAF